MRRGTDGGAKIVRVLGLLLACFGLEASGAPGTEWVQGADADLDGDGRKEAIALKSGELTAGRARLELDSDQGTLDGFRVVDLDTADRFKEIELHAESPGGQDVFVLVAYDGKSLRRVAGGLGRISVQGNAIVLETVFQSFWSRTEKWILASASGVRTLKRVPQEVYYVGASFPVLKSFPIYRTREKKEVVANLRPESQVLFLLHSPGKDDADASAGFYLLKSETGLVGWVDVPTFFGKLDGLVWAG